MARISASGMPPFYADRSKTGAFFVYDADVDTNADTNADTNLDVDVVPQQQRWWQPLTARAFRWMVDAIHRQLLGEYRGWAIDANDNSDEFIETSMRFGAIIVGGNMEWSSFMTKLKTKMWTLALDAQSP
jgi:hypothetical protein